MTVTNSTKSPKSCAHCQTTFVPRPAKQKFCSRICASRSNGKHQNGTEAVRETRACVLCGTPFTFRLSNETGNLRRGLKPRRFCGLDCYHKSVHLRPRPDERPCSSCGKVLPFNRDHFAVNSKRATFGLLTVCKPCTAASAKLTGRSARVKLRTEILTAYGNGRMACVCCGEFHHEFLSLDHINGGGAAERKHTTSDKLYRRLRKAGFPKGKHRTLCFNCNWCYGHYGYCPHRRQSP